MPYRRHREFEVPSTVGNPRTEVTYSELASFATCELQYWFQHEDGRHVMPHNTTRQQETLSPASFGRFIHKVIADLFGHPASIRNESLAGQLVRRQWPDELRSPAGYRQMNQAEKLVVGLCEYLRPDLADVPRGGIEMSVEAEIGGRVLSGRIDLVVQGADRVLTLVDFKTGRQIAFPEGVLYSDVKSRNVEKLPVQRLATDDDFFQLRTYDLLLSEREPDKQPRRLMLVNLSESKFWDTYVSYGDRNEHRKVLTELIDTLGAAEKSRLWEARHGQHCRRCEVQRFCPLSRGYSGTVIPPKAMYPLSPWESWR
jgi:CRISPR/Cas system-associated exonuclease Cas4 (RecB family)